MEAVGPEIRNVVPSVRWTDDSPVLWNDGCWKRPVSRTSGQLYGVVSQFQANTKYQSDRDSEKILLKIPFPTGQDIGGHLFFGYDGYLYISVGHGGPEQEEFAQNRLSLLGKILRIDVAVASDGKNYSIPSDNPIVENGGQGRKEIYASGARSMWRCSLDSGDVSTGEGRGRIFCGDVGAETYEEVNIIQKGGNYGWNEREGYECRMRRACHDLEMEVMPISVYEHTLVRAAVVGGYMYRGKGIPSVHGQYIFGDASSGEMFRLVEPKKRQSQWISYLLTVCDKSQCPCSAREEQPKHIVSFSTDRDEELYVLTTTSLMSEWATGAIYKLVAPIGNRNDKLTCAGNTTRWSVLAVLVWLFASVTFT
ncbi:HHIP-like protein 2 [Liolophura sinensis]|uniref:HHIP-like protein 2 n=1 Tax=Liolophura sinensis TaxID=3198878 RepID=UPI003159638E